MGIDVDGGKAHQHVERQDGEDEATAAGAQCQQHDDRRYTNMTAGEGGGGTLAGIVGDVEQMVEEAVAPTGSRHTLTMRQEPVAKIGEDALGYLVGANKLTYLITSTVCFFLVF